MNLQSLVLLALIGGIILTVIGLGLDATGAHVAFLFRRPGLFARSMLSMNVVAPVAAASLAATFALHPAVKIAMVALAVSPVPPFLPRKEAKASGGDGYPLSLLVVAGLLSIVFVPLALEALQRVFDVPLSISAAGIAKTVALTILLPLGVGMAVNRMAPGLARRSVKTVGLAGTVLLLLALLAVLPVSFGAMMSLVGNGTLVAMVVLVIILVAAGHLLGGPRIGNRSTLALSTATRHPGIALAIVSANFPDEKLALPAVLLYAIVSTVATAPYVAWMRRRALKSGSAA